MNGLYTIFGKVIYGFEALDLMEAETVDANYKPLNDIKIYSTTIHANPIAEKEQFWVYFFNNNNILYYFFCF